MTRSSLAKPGFIRHDGLPGKSVLKGKTPAVLAVCLLEIRVTPGAGRISQLPLDRDSASWEGFMSRIGLLGCAAAMAVVLYVLANGPGAGRKSRSRL